MGEGARVRREIHLPAPPEVVWPALTSAALLEWWLAPEVELEPVAGGRIAVREADGRAREGAVEELEAPYRLAFHWAEGDGAPSRVELTLRAAPGGSRLVVVETAARTTALAGGWAPRLRALARGPAALVAASRPS